jgi:hypothetical protein
LCELRKQDNEVDDTMSGKETLPAAQPPWRKNVARMTKRVGIQSSFVATDFPVRPNWKREMFQTQNAIGTKVLIRKKVAGSESEFLYHEGEVVAVEQSSSLTTFQCKFETLNPEYFWYTHDDILEMAQGYLDYYSYDSEDEDEVNENNPHKAKE